ncbi:MAG TPA: hypothetical protein VM870_01630 [Pyrinomonadaceae bacterium]|jgi:uncharacterized protein YhaN|nr:hypothetical protein [Pyrinomonadaceae bacterium]
MADENLLATFEQSLRQARATRSRLATRLHELEAEADKVRGEMSAVEALADQTEQAIYRLLTSMMGRQTTIGTPAAAVSDAELEAAMREDSARMGSANGAVQPHRQNSPPAGRGHVTELVSDRFLDRTIPQAATVLLRESAGPLHVNEIHKRLLEGGFNFTGHNPTISIAVSLNRNRRFRKVAPGTFDLVIRDAAQAS